MCAERKYMIEILKILQEAMSKIQKLVNKTA